MDENFVIVKIPRTFFLTSKIFIYRYESTLKMRNIEVITTDIREFFILLSLKYKVSLESNETDLLIFQFHESNQKSANHYWSWTHV